jgi:hypothetical protein
MRIAAGIRAAGQLGLLLCLAVPARAAITFSGTGPGADGGTVSAQAEFSISGNVLTIVLTNTSAPTPTGNNGQVVTGVVWSFDPKLDGTLSLYGVNPQLTNGAPTSDPYNVDPALSYDHIWVAQQSSSSTTTYGIDDTVQLGGTWTSKTSSAFADAGVGDFGYATTGADGLFAMGTIVGPKPGSANYGLVSDATYLTNPVTLPNGTGPQSLPLVQNSITIRFYYDGDDLDESRIVDAKFLVGTSGDYVEMQCDTPPNLVPEPASMSVWGVLLVMIGAGCSRRRMLRRNGLPPDNVPSPVES